MWLCTHDCGVEHWNGGEERDARFVREHLEFKRVVEFVDVQSHSLDIWWRFWWRSWWR